MNGIMSFYFLSQRYESDYLLFIKVQNDFKNTSPDDIHATHLSHKFVNHFEVWKSISLPTAVIITLYVNSQIKVSRNTYHSNMQYIHAKSDQLN